MGKFWLPVILAWAAGFVDSLGFLALSHEFTSHMSGNAAAAGAELGSGNLHETLILFSAIPGFFAGVCLGVAASFWTKGNDGRTAFRLVLVMECAALVCFIVIAATRPYPVAKGSGWFFVLVECLAFAMGLQAAALRNVQNVKVSTTFVTGMLTNTAVELTRYLLSPKTDDSRAESGLHALLFGSIFMAFLVGGVAGAMGHRFCGPYAPLPPILMLIAVAVMPPKPDQAVAPK